MCLARPGPLTSALFDVRVVLQPAGYAQETRPPGLSGTREMEATGDGWHWPWREGRIAWQNAFSTSSMGNCTQTGGSHDSDLKIERHHHRLLRCDAGIDICLGPGGPQAERTADDQCHRCRWRPAGQPACHRELQESVSGSRIAIRFHESNGP